MLYRSKSSAGNVYTGHINDTEQNDVNYNSTCQIALNKQALAINMSIFIIL